MKILFLTPYFYPEKGAPQTRLLDYSLKLLERGHSIIIIEHNMEVIKCADYVVDLGPEGGDAGGLLLYEGDVKGLAKDKKSYTGQYLKSNL